ncbi:MAG: thiamine phosphate synthase [Sediminibacterium sp.]
MMKQIGKLHYITTSAKLAELACAGGVKWIQLRLKNIDYHTHKSVAKEVQAVCKQYAATLIINDNVSLALDIRADGVHLGKEDMPPAKAREILGNDCIIGATANTMEDLLRVSRQQINYIGLGPFRFTTTKEKLSPIVGLEGYRAIFNQLKENHTVIPPVVGIGGIVLEDIGALLLTGLHGVAVSGAISSGSDVTATASLFVHACQQELKSLYHE